MDVADELQGGHVADRRVVGRDRRKAPCRSTRVTSRRAVAALAAAVAMGAVAWLGGASAGAATSPGMPTAPIGEMALDWGQQNYLGTTSQFRYIILQDSMYQSVPAIKAANPGTKVLVYKDVAATDDQCQYDAHRDTGVSYCYAKQYHPEWFIRNSSGAPFAFCDFPNDYWMDIGNSGYQQAWLQDVVQAAKADGFDGVFMDDTNTHPGHCEDNGGLSGDTPSYTDQQYGAAMDSFIAYAGPGLKANGLLAVPDVSADPWTSWMETDALDMVPDISVFFDEMFMHWGSGSSSIFTDSMWSAKEQQMASVSASGNYYANMYSNGSTASAADMLYGRASFLLAWNGSVDSAFQYHVDCLCSSYDPLWATDIGTPIGSRYQVGYAWRRDFTGGVALVDPSSTYSQTVNLGGTYTDPYNNQVTSVTLNPGSATILTVTGSTTPPTDSIPPTVSGAPVEGQTLTVSPGSWSGNPPPTYSYQWERCSTTSATSCTAITGATAAAYTVAPADVGDYLAAAVTAANTAGSSTASSAETAQVPVPTFTLTGSPSSDTVKRGHASNYTIMINPQNGFTTAVTLSVTGLPPGASATFTPASTTGSSTLAVATTAASVGTSVLTVSGSAGGQTSSTKLGLTVR